MTFLSRRLQGLLKPMSQCLAAMASLTAPAAEPSEDASSQSEQILYSQNSQPAFSGPADLFVGEVDVQVLFPDNPQTAFSGAYVTFQPGARTAWHTHPAGQHMVVTDGWALTGTRDGRVLLFEEGETVWCPADIDHWHGATQHRAMTHLVITGDKNGENVTWKEQVTDKAYQDAVAKTSPATPELSGLSQQEAALVPVAAFTASGELPALRTAFNRALDAGVTINELKESVLHLYAYLGFPRALNAMSVLMSEVDARESTGKKDQQGEQGITLGTTADNEALGKEVQTSLAGGPVEGPLFRFAPAANTYLQRHLFGDLFARGVIDAATREILTVSALANLQGAAPQLQAHMSMSANAGVTPAQLSDIRLLLKTYVGSRSSDAVEDALQPTTKE